MSRVVLALILMFSVAVAQAPSYTPACEVTPVFVDMWIEKEEEATFVIAAIAGELTPSTCDIYPIGGSFVQGEDGILTAIIQGFPVDTALGE